MPIKQNVTAPAEAAWPGLSASFKIVTLYWVPFLVWVSVVFAASSDSFSAQHTALILFAVYKSFGGINLHTFDVLHFLIRKCAHLTEYAVLSALCFRAVRGPKVGGWRGRWIAAALAAALLIAMADEFHQSFVPSRNGNAKDVVLDFCGAALAQLVIWIMLNRRRARVLQAANGD